jgi:alpha-pyrone synthase
MRSSSQAIPPVCIHRIATATPPNDVHAAFLERASGMLRDQRVRSVLTHMAKRSGIDHRYSYIQADSERMQGWPEAEVVFRPGYFPATRKRMELFESFAPRLLRCALDRLALNTEERSKIRHVIVTCCTGLFSPGLDFAAIDHLHLGSNTERTVIGFMGCYAAINGLKLARHIVRSEPDASVLMVNLELCSLHFQETQELEKMLSFLLFGDGCAASLIRAGDHGIALDEFRAITVPEASDLIRWSIGDSGFDMELSGEVPGELRKTLRERAKELDPHSDIDLWAVHPGGRSILDAVQIGLELAADKLTASRAILRRFGNMSSATIMFVLQELMRTAQAGQRGCAMSFGPGLTAETMNFHVL